ncbi:hypothetical protein [Geobacter sp.]|uniref:hypothetical protein n=1 Tax=Geobacter sp. TaxID=46610 RepID=UPI00261A9C15|nr:hypothetical protein [Geobacter sp.]
MFKGIILAIKARRHYQQLRREQAARAASTAVALAITGALSRPGHRSALTGAH